MIVFTYLCSPLISFELCHAIGVHLTATFFNDLQKEEQVMAVQNSESE